MADYETVAVLAPAPDALPDWPATWAEVPGERFEHEGVTFAVVSVPAGATDPRIRRDLAPMTCEGGTVTDRYGRVVGTCCVACPGTRGLYPVELAGRESCQRAIVYPEPEADL